MHGLAFTAEAVERVHEADERQLYCVVGVGVLCVLAIGALIRQGGAAGYEEKHKNDKRTSR